MGDKIQGIVEGICKSMNSLDCVKAVVGFDGFVDCILRVVKNKEVTGKSQYFESMREFGEYLIDKSGKSCSLELNEVATKIGGNMPIMANTLGSLGIKTDCIGAMGYPDVDPLFKTMSGSCTLHTIAKPGYTTALEFNDGKVMLGQMDSLNRLTWDMVKDYLGMENIRNMFLKSNLICMVNWSELDCTTSIWEGILEDVMPHHTPNKNQIMFFDLSDCSKRSRKEILQALELIKRFSTNFKVVFGLNENEARLVYNALKDNADTCDIGLIGDTIYSAMGIDVIVIHPVKCSMAWTASGIFKAQTLFVNKPKISTGGGDNFNAGLCAGLLMGLDPEASLIMANSTSAYYVKNGCSPSLLQLVDFIKENSSAFAV